MFTKSGIAIGIIEITFRLHVYLRSLVAVLDGLCQTAQVAAEPCLVEHQLAVAAEPAATHVLAADDDTGCHHVAATAQNEVF